VTDRMLTAEQIFWNVAVCSLQSIFWKGEYGITVTDRMLIAEHIFWNITVRSLQNRYFGSESMEVL
jgi:hypothetical protein